MSNDAGGNTSGNPPLKNVPDNLVVFHHSELAKLEEVEAKAKETAKAAGAKKRKYLKTIQADGIKLKNFDRAREILLAADDDEVRNDLAEIGSILRAFNHPISHQFDLFEQPDRSALEEQWRFDGFRAGSNNVGSEQNPHRSGDDGYKHWLQGWHDAQKCIVAGMSMSQSTPADPEPEAEPEPIEPADDDLPVEAETEADDEDPLAGDGDDWRAERDEADPVDDEESALKGIEA